MRAAARSRAANYALSLPTSPLSPTCVASSKSERFVPRAAPWRASIHSASSTLPKGFHNPSQLSFAARDNNSRAVACQWYSSNSKNPPTNPNTSQLDRTIKEQAPSTLPESPPIEPGLQNLPPESIQTPSSAPDAALPNTPPSGPSQPDATPPKPSLPTTHPPTLAARLSPHIDSLLSRVAHLSERVNTYTGTSYAPIAELRGSIASRESQLKTLHARVAAAKATHSAAVSAQTSAQTELVRLLERRAGWTAAELDRYTALVRDEHAHERGTAAARTALDAAERGLEEGRAELERLERRLYREEGVWSDTIRRNSTWVTFALMGLNVALLLGNVVVVEPWRRRRMVREVRAAVDDKVGGGALSEAQAELQVRAEAEQQGKTWPQSQVKAQAQAEAEAQVDAATAPAGVPLETLSGHSSHAAPLGDAIPPATAKSNTLTHLRARWHDLFSERIIALKRVDVTVAMLEGAAAGAACMGLVFVVLRPR